MLKGVAWLLGFQTVGELASSVLQLPISGPVVGMALLLACLVWRGGVPDDLQRVADNLLANMPILFVPVGAGLIAHLDLFQRQWLVVIIGVVGGTFMTLGATALVTRFLMKRTAVPTTQSRPLHPLSVCEHHRD